MIQPTVGVNQSAEPERGDLVPTTEQTPVSDSIPAPQGTPAIPVVIPSVSIPETPVPLTPVIKSTVVLSQSTEPERVDLVPTTEQTPVSDSIPVLSGYPAISVVIPSVSIPKIPVPLTPVIKPTVVLSQSSEPVIKICTQKGADSGYQKRSACIILPHIAGSGDIGRHTGAGVRK